MTVHHAVRIFGLELPVMPQDLHVIQANSHPQRFYHDLFSLPNLKSVNSHSGSGCRLRPLKCCIVKAKYFFT